MINFENWDVEDPVSWGLPPISREGLITCDEYSPNYEKACTEGGEDYDFLCKITEPC